MNTTTSRRGFIGAFALSAAACAVAEPLQQAAGAMSQMDATSPLRLGLASYTFKNFSRSELIGFMKQLNVFDLSPKDVRDHLPAAPMEEAKALEDYAKAGIRLHACGDIPFDKDDDSDIRSKFEYCKRANLSLMTVRDITPKTLSRVEKFVREYGISIAINSRPEDAVWPTPESVMKSIRDMDPRIGCCVDVGHATRAGQDIVASLHDVGLRLLNVHINDRVNSATKGAQSAIGQGNMPIPAIFETLMRSRYAGFVDLEYEAHPEDPMPGAIASLSYMRGVLSGIMHGALSPTRTPEAQVLTSIVAGN